MSTRQKRTISCLISHTWLFLLEHVNQLTWMNLQSIFIVAIPNSEGVATALPVFNVIYITTYILGHTVPLFCFFKSCHASRHSSPWPYSDSWLPHACPPSVSLLFVSPLTGYVVRNCVYLTSPLFIHSFSGPPWHWTTLESCLKPA